EDQSSAAVVGAERDIQRRGARAGGSEASRGGEQERHGDARAQGAPVHYGEGVLCVRDCAALDTRSHEGLWWRLTDSSVLSVSPKAYWIRHTPLSVSPRVEAIRALAWPAR